VCLPAAKHGLQTRNGNQNPRNIGPKPQKPLSGTRPERNQRVFPQPLKSCPDTKLSRRRFVSSLKVLSFGWGPFGFPEFRPSGPLRSGMESSPLQDRPELPGAENATNPPTAMLTEWRTRSSRSRGTPGCRVTGSGEDDSACADRSGIAEFPQEPWRELQNRIWDSTQLHLGP
jgi:hypothetical protein